jgi:transposase InsO family protein
VKPTQKPRRGFEKQRSHREWERAVKIDALAVVRRMRWAGYSLAETARRLHLRKRTLAQWEQDWKTDRLALAPRGRPLVQSDRETREALSAIFYLAGPGIGLPTLREVFPQIAKGELQDLLAHYKSLNLFKKSQVVHTLRWQRPGAVWAIDFTEPPLPVDNQYRYVLGVRDLASGNLLLALPSITKEAGVVVEALEALFKSNGAPLVLKSDVGFVAAEIDACLSRYEVCHLLSPTYYPQYNGSVEAGFGSLKVRAHYQAARHGHPGEWSSDDVEAARMQANEWARPWGFNNDSPLVAWLHREPISPRERRAVRKTVEDLESEVRAEHGLLPGIEGSKTDERNVRRTCITRALIRHGFLLVRRRRFTQPFKSTIWEKIS